MGGGQYNVHRVWKFKAHHRDFGNFKKSSIGLIPAKLDILVPNNMPFRKVKHFKYILKYFRNKPKF